MNELMMFEGKNVEVFEFKGNVLFNPKHVAECLEIVDVNSSMRNFNDKQVIKLTNSIMHDTQFRKLHNTGEKFLTESGVYKLIFKSHKEEAEKFQDWVTDEVLPTIRKTGGYVANSDLMVNTYFSGLDDNYKLIVKGLFVNIEEQQKKLLEKDKTIQIQSDDIIKKQEVIQGFSDDITLAEKRQILNNIIRQGGNARTIQDRYKLLYKEFNLKMHVDISTRYENHCDKFDKMSRDERKDNCMIRVKSKMDYVDKVMDMIPELYEVSVKLFKSDIDKLIQNMYELREVS